jgi:hypothetical protein
VTAHSDPSFTATAAARGLTGRTMAGLAWMLAGTGAQTLLKLAVLMVLARLLSPAEFGLVATSLMIVVLLNGVGRLGVAPAIVQHPELDDTHKKAGFNIANLLGLAIAALIFGAAAPLERFFEMEGLGGLLHLLAVVAIEATRAQIERNFDLIPPSLTIRAQRTRALQMHQPQIVLRHQRLRMRPAARPPRLLDHRAIRPLGLLQVAATL